MIMNIFVALLLSAHTLTDLSRKMDKQKSKSTAFFSLSRLSYFETNATITLRTFLSCWKLKVAARASLPTFIYSTHRKCHCASRTSSVKWAKKLLTSFAWHGFGQCNLHENKLRMPHLIVRLHLWIDFQNQWNFWFILSLHFITEYKLIFY